jgi:hypothetical protein
MTGDGFTVDVETMQQFVGEVPSYAEQASKFADLVGQADVSNESWGVVGLFTKQGYDELLRSLQDMLGQMKQGCRRAADKFAQAAETYQTCDREAADGFRQIASELGDD